jgi:transcription factor IIIB subunit 2
MLNYIPSDSTAVSWNPSSALMKKNYSNDNYQLLPVISTLKTDPEGIISLSDIDDEEIDQMILNEEESRLKKVIWDNLNREWIKVQK